MITDMYKAYMFDQLLTSQKLLSHIDLLTGSRIKVTFSVRKSEAESPV